MAKGRQKGQTKIMSKIKDEVIAPYELWIEEDQVVLMDTTKNKPMGYYGKLEGAIKRISKLSLVSKQKDYTLAGFIESYNNTIGLKKGSYGIFNTSQLIKCLNILDGDILVETKSSNGLASKLNLADTNYDIKFSLADPAVIPKVPQINDSDQPSASFEISDEFITRFVKSKDALNDLPSFTIEAKEGGFSGHELIFFL